MKMQIGDYVGTWEGISATVRPLGVVISFNGKGEGGKHFVHVMTPNGVEIFPMWNLHVIEPEDRNGTANDRKD